VRQSAPSLLEGIRRSRAWEEEEGWLRAEKEEDAEARALARRSGPAAVCVSMADERGRGAACQLRWRHDAILLIPKHFEPGPTRPAGPARARPAHESYWTGVGRDLEAREIFFGPSPARNAVFSCFTL
jgi:hypothetical protein